MRSIRVSKFAVVGLLLLAAYGVTATALAQDTLVALGRVDALGNLDSSQNTVGGVVSSMRNGTGDYTVTIDAVGAFSGAVATDFVVELSLATLVIDDNSIKCDVSVTSDQLTIDVFTIDLEDSLNANGGAAQDSNFSFLIRRVPAGATTVADGTRFLSAHGSVNLNGSLANAYGVDGIVVSSAKNATGSYSITLTKTGDFAGDGAADYLLFLTPINGNTDDQVLNGGASNIASDDAVTFLVRSTDVQDSGSDDNVTAIDNAFWFSIYRLNTGLGGDPDTRFLSALANVRGSDGASEIAVGAETGMVVNTARNSEGDYTITLTSLGSFAGKTESDFVAIVTLRQAGTQDEASNALITVINENTLEVDVNTNDLEQSGIGAGVATDTDFALALYSVDPLVQPDLRIGTKRKLTGQRGDDVINSNGAAQKIRLKLIDRRKERFYFTLENDGNVVDDVRITEVGGGKFLKSKYFDIQGGGRVNVSAKVRTGAEVTSDLRPGKLNRFEGQTRYKKLSKRPKRKMQITGRSVHSPTSADTVKAKVVVDNRS